MSNILWKSFNLCFSKFKCLPIITFTPPLPNIQQQHHTNSSSSPSHVTISGTIGTEISTTVSASFDDYDMHDDSVPDFSSAFASHRFFFSTPGSSKSIFEQPRLAASGRAVEGGVAVRKFTTDPYADFRESMQEMIEAHDWSADVKSSGDFLHELLLCYLTLNPKHTHKFIIDAFSDIVMSLVPPPPVCCREKTHRRRRLRSGLV